METCIYCGETATTLDHVTPRAYLSSSKRTSRPGKEPGFTVPACVQCNSILGTRMFKNLVERKAFVHKRLLVKLRKYNASVAWDEEELSEMGYGLRSMLEIAMAKRSIARDRIRYSGGPPEHRWLATEEAWVNSLSDDPRIPSSSRCTA